MQLSLKIIILILKIQFFDLNLVSFSNHDDKLCFTILERPCRFLYTIVGPVAGSYGRSCSSLLQSINPKKRSPQWHPFHSEKVCDFSCIRQWTRRVKDTAGTLIMVNIIEITSIPFKMCDESEGIFPYVASCHSLYVQLETHWMNKKQTKNWSVVNFLH